MTNFVVWITGARGFIGQHLAAYLAARGHQVSGVGHGSWPAADAAQQGLRHWINGGVTGSNLYALRELSGPPGVVFHLAGGSSVAAAINQPGEDFTRTVVSTVALLEWIRLASPEARLVVASSAAVYGSGHTGRISEIASLRPHSPYGHHKLMMENLCRSYGTTFGISSAVARLFSLYGGGLRKQLLWDLCTRLCSSEVEINLGGSGEELRDWVDVSDAVAALAAVSAMVGRDVPTVNVGTGVGTSVQQVAKLVMNSWVELEKNPRKLTFTGVARPGDPVSLVADPTLLTVRGITCSTGVAPGIERYVRWYQAIVRAAQ